MKRSREMLELSSMSCPLSFKYLLLERSFDWIKLFLGITLCFQKDECCIRGQAATYYYL